MIKMKKYISIILVTLLVLSVPPMSVNATKKVKLNRNKATLYIGKSVSLKAWNNGKKVKWTTSNKKLPQYLKKEK